MDDDARRIIKVLFDKGNEVDVYGRMAMGLRMTMMNLLNFILVIFMKSEQFLKLRYYYGIM